MNLIMKVKSDLPIYDSRLYIFVSTGVKLQVTLYRSFVMKITLKIPNSNWIMFTHRTSVLYFSHEIMVD